jgi:hypothetical protein
LGEFEKKFFFVDLEKSSIRRDSASSSDQSSLSSNASNYESPYASNVNVNGKKIQIYLQIFSLYFLKASNKTAQLTKKLLFLLSHLN